MGWDGSLDDRIWVGGCGLSEWLALSDWMALGGCMGLSLALNE